MKKRFKIGPCKTRDGGDAYIFEVSENDGLIFGKIKVDGKWSAAGVWPLRERYEADKDLMPNCEPEKIVIEKARFIPHDSGGIYWFTHIVHDLSGKSWKLTLEACDD